MLKEVQREEKRKENQTREEKRGRKCARGEERRDSRAGTWLSCEPPGWVRTFTGCLLALTSELQVTVEML